MASSATFQGQQGIECFLLLLTIFKKFSINNNLQIILSMNNNNYY